MFVAFPASLIHAQDDPPSELVVLNHVSSEISRLQQAGDLAGAAKIGLAAVARVENIMLPSEPALLFVRVQLGFVLGQLGRRDEAEQQLRIAEYQARITNNNALLTMVLNTRSGLSSQMNLGVSSLEQAQQALALQRAAYPRDEGALADALIMTASASALAGFPAESLSLYLEADRLLASKTDPAFGPRKFAVKTGEVQCYSALGDERRVTPLLDELIALAPSPDQKILAARQKLFHQKVEAFNRGDWNAAIALTTQIENTGKGTYRETPELRAAYIENLAFA